MLTDKKVANAVVALRSRLARTVKHNEGRESANATKLADECAKTKRRFLRWAFKHKYHTIDDFKYFSPYIRIAKNEPICLTEKVYLAPCSVRESGQGLHLAFCPTSDRIDLYAIEILTYKAD